jgi:hypothetical protein
LIVRRLIVIAIALLLAGQVIRNAAVSALARLHPATAAKLWAGHPAVEISVALSQIGADAREHRPIGGETFAMIDDAAVKSPLAPEPFLVEGVRAQTGGDRRAESRAFRAAQWRDPRSVPAAYFLAQYYFRTGRALEGLEETTLLARLLPGAAKAVAPFVAAYAQTPGNWPQIRTLFRSQAGLEDQVLAVLSRDPRNTEAIVALADASHRSPGSPWLATLLQSLVASGDYGRAHAIWTSIGQGSDQGQLIFDSSFSSPGPPPPFNWSLTTSAVGLAERQPGKRLHAIFYGNDDGVLASELLMLPAGTYHLQMQRVGVPVHPEALNWSIRCDKAEDLLANADMNQVVARGLTFQVPANCPAQWLVLSGCSGDIAQQAEITVTALSLVKVGTHG